VKGVEEDGATSQLDVESKSRSLLQLPRWRGAATKAGVVMGWICRRVTSGSLSRTQSDSGLDSKGGCGRV
jgi:hypothetical protein